MQSPGATRRSSTRSAIASALPERYTSYDELLQDPNVDAVHINSPIADHAPQSIAALKAGKHVASTVPAATTIDECRQIVEAQRKSGKVYMMMETVVYSREYLFAKELYDRGELGRIQFMRGSHQQDMDGWPGYWEGFPPMHYATHCVSPCLAILGKHAEHVVCHGSGRIDEALDSQVRQPVRHRDRDVQAARLRRRRRGHAQPVRHGAAVSRELRRLRLEEVVRVAAGRERRAGDPHQEHDGQAAHRSADPRAREGARLCAPLPEPIQSFTLPAAIQDAEHLSFLQGGGHGGSHPHLVHNFLLACLGEKPAMPDAETSVNWTMVGICAHQSALKNGEKIVIPRF